MHLVEILLPLCDNQGARFAPAEFAAVRTTLIEKFGGLTSFNRAPADGTEKQGGRERHDELIVFEIMAGEVDKAWWAAYRRRLEKTFKQDRILIRVSEVMLL
ncbi:MAG TPA: hypothetical protein VGO49_16505 [Bradyrhizobium sp.]|jgi:hypothetical protein|nr:hypothetical protein [Bradyrhizobium sp.]